MKIIEATLVLIYDADQILLGMKKRGFGAGRWNGFGGKVKKNEKIHEAAQRELKEEIGVSVSHNDRMFFRGRIDFSFENKKEEVQIVYFFSVNTADIVGKPEETSEMRPQWFFYDAIPYHAMWPDDQYWLPLFLKGKDLSGSVILSTDGCNIIQNNIIFEKR
jgi:8-oxo-dGTP pyrophosphatase MutT (NUDIX family)